MTTRRDARGAGRIALLAAALLGATLLGGYVTVYESDEDRVQAERGGGLTPEGRVEGVTWIDVMDSANGRTKRRSWLGR